jgi:hypothetical protein
MLHLPIPGFATGISQGKVGEDKAGNPALFNNIPSAPQYNRGQAICLKMAADQTHGLVAYRSKCREENGIEFVLAAPLKNLGSGTLNRVFLAVICRYPVEAGRGRPYMAVCSELGEAVHR